VTQGALGFALSFLLLAGAATAQQQQTVPNAPAPQAASSQTNNLQQLTDQMAPGKGIAAPAAQNSAPSAPAPQAQDQQDQTQAPAGNEPQKTPPEMPPPGKPVYRLVVPVTYVNVPVTVLDKHGHPVAGLTWRQFRVFEDGVRQHISYFTEDPFPMSVVFVVDQTLPRDVMRKINQSIDTVTAGLAPFDSAAVVTYSGTGPKLATNFTAANSPRLIAAINASKRSGERMGVPSIGGPMMSGPTINGQQVDPNLAPQRGNSGFLMVPKQTHPLNDAILYAANLLASQPRGRKRVIYVISDGKESRSQASYREVVRYLLTNNISVYGTLVGDASIWGVGFLDKVHLPLVPPEDVLPKYCVATGGEVDSEFTENGMQQSFSRILSTVRGQYTLMYISHKSTLSGKYRSIDVRVEGIPGLTILAKRGYYPSASMNQ
jgi:VWFA-related protein